MSKSFSVQTSQRRNRDGTTTVFILVETIAKNGKPHQGPIIISCPYHSVPDLSGALEIAAHTLENLSLELSYPCPVR